MNQDAASSALVCVHSEATRTAVAAAATTAARTLAILGFVDLQRTTVHISAIQRLHGAGGVGIVHLNESETAWAARIAIGNQRDFLDRSVLGKQQAHRLVRGGERQISNI